MILILHIPCEFFILTLTGVWMTVSLHKSPSSQESKPILAVLWSGWFWFCLWSPIHPVSFPDSWKLSRMLQLRFVSLLLCWEFVVLVCVGGSQRIPLSGLVQNPHKGPEREICARNRKKAKEARSEYTLALAHRIHSVTDVSFLALGADPSPCLFVCSFLPPSRLCVLCVRKEMCSAPSRRWEKPLDDLI